MLLSSLSRRHHYIHPFEWVKHLGYCRYLVNPCLGKAFCQSHCAKIEKLGYPTELKPFLKFCGDNITPVNPENYTKQMKEKVDIVVKKISKLLEVDHEDLKSSTDAQGMF